MLKRGEKYLPPVHPNAGLQAGYRRKLDRLIEAMHASVVWWVKAGYRANEPEIAQDASPAAELDRVMKKLSRYWQKQFQAAAPELAKYFAQTASKQTDRALQAILKKAGIAVKFKLTAPMNDVVQATVHENVSLITSIADKYLTDVEGLVMRSVQRGRDVGGLAEDLQKRLTITKKRAQLIARDQNNKATANIVSVRQQSLGITEAVWLHSAGGREPRPTHVANDGKRYNVKEGWYDPAEKEFVWPGQLINCRCVSRSIIPGLERT